MLQLHILEQSKKLNPLKDKIKKAYEEIVPIVESKIKLPNIDIVVADNPEGAIPEIGIGGNSPTANLIYINIDSNFSRIEDKIDEQIKSTLAHECHHCARAEHFYYGNNLLEALVTEGLADHFDLEINGGNPKPWSVALDENHLNDLLGVAKKEFDNQNYDHTSWFFGKDKLEIPRWAGYSLGFKIVSEYLSKTNKKVSELFSLDSRKFII